MRVLFMSSCDGDLCVASVLAMEYNFAFDCLERITLKLN